MHPRSENVFLGDGFRCVVFRQKLLQCEPLFCYSGEVRLLDKMALPGLVILLLAGAGLWRVTFNGSIPVERFIQLRQGLSADEKMTAYVDGRDLPKAVRMYTELTGRELVPSQATWSLRLDRLSNGRLSRWGVLKRATLPDSGISYHRDGCFSAGEIKQDLEDLFRRSGLNALPEGTAYYRLERSMPIASTHD